MNENMNPCTTTIDENGHPYSNRLRQLRIKSGKSEEEICNLLSMAFIDYDELENHSGEHTRVISLDEISKLARALGVPSRKIFSDSIETEKLVSLNQLSSKIKNYLDSGGISVDQFENRVGFEIGPGVEDSTKIMNWNLDCLRFVCAEIGVSWLDALP